MDSNEKSEITWYTGERCHEGFPLLLRFPEKPDFDALQNLYPQLLTITHVLDSVAPSGLPTPQYNDTLEDLDMDLTGTFQIPGKGQVVLVETFGGSRNYYVYVESASVAELKLRFASDYPEHSLEWEVRDDPEWKFIRRYSSDYRFYPQK